VHGYGSERWHQDRTSKLSFPAIHFHNACTGADFDILRRLSGVLTTKVACSTPLSASLTHDIRQWMKVRMNRDTVDDEQLNERVIFISEVEISWGY